MKKFIWLDPEKRILVLMAGPTSAVPDELGEVAHVDRCLGDVLLPKRAQ